MSDHARHEENTGAYLLDALTQLERQAFEQHLIGCSLCREEVERLRPAADALPRSVTPLAAPPSVRTSLMAIVEGEARQAREREGAPPRVPLRTRLARLAPAMGPTRPTLAWVSAAFVLAVGLLSGYAVAQLLSDEDPRTVTARADERRLPLASGSLSVPEDGGAILRVHGMPRLESNRVYQVWIQRGDAVVSQSIFEVGEDGSGAAAVPDAHEGAEAVLVTRERSGGARVPSEKPVLQVRL
jgi:Anti-sigma-K factor rskA/Putative zinc-finger